MNSKTYASKSRLNLVTSSNLCVKYFSKSKWGRIYPKKCINLGIMRRPIRHFLCSDLYYDIDIKNCHPTILYNVCQHYNIKTKSIKKYVLHRDEVIKDIGLGKSQAKQYITSISRYI